MPYEEILTSNKWTFKDSCTCRGTFTKNYVNTSFPGLLLKVKPKRDAWQVLFNGRMIKFGSLETLEIGLGALAS